MWPRIQSQSARYQTKRWLCSTEFVYPWWSVITGEWTQHANMYQMAGKTCPFLVKLREQLWEQLVLCNSGSLISLCECARSCHQPRKERFAASLQCPHFLLKSQTPFVVAAGMATTCDVPATHSFFKLVLIRSIFWSHASIACIFCALAPKVY
jgi:hypothetical protein